MEKFELSSSASREEPRRNAEAFRLPEIEESEHRRRDEPPGFDREVAGPTYPPHPSRRPRVALAMNSIMYGGVEEHVILLSRTLPAYGYDPVVICAENEALRVLIDRLDDNGVRRIPLDISRGGIRTQIQATRAMTRLLREEKIDLLHVQLIGHEGGRVPLISGRLAQVPTVVTHHIAPREPVRLRKRLARAPFLQGVDAFIAVSEANRQAQIDHMGLPSERIHRVHNGIVPPGFLADRAENLQELREEARMNLCDLMGVSEETPIIGCVGRLAEQKGYHWLLQAAPEILRNVPEAHIVFIGDGPLGPNLQEQAETLGIGSRAHWLGFRKDGALLMAGLDVLAMPSAYEGLPIVLLEAMAAGVPVVAHAVDGIPEALNDGVEGWLVQCGDVATLAARLSYVLTHPREAHTMGERARARLLSDFTVDVMTANTVALYDRVLAQRAGATRHAASVPAG